MRFSDATSLAIESWTLYAVAIMTVVARLVSRTILLGSVRKWEIDDYLMILVVLLYTVVIVGVNQTSVNLNNYLPDSFFATITPAQTASAIYGSKWAFATEICKVTMVWGCKACMLTFYNHMTKGLPKFHQTVKYVGLYTLIGYLVVIVCYLAAWCHPLRAYWAVPVSKSQLQCASYYNHLINDAVWNISSDLMILCLPLPLLIKAQLPLKRKIILLGIFSLGVLVILCAILNRYYNFTGGFGDLSYLNWYAGETSTAVIVVNVPHLWPLLSRLLGLGSFRSANIDDDSNNNNSGNRFTIRNGKVVPLARDRGFRQRSESEERFVVKNAGAGVWAGGGSRDDVEMVFVKAGDQRKGYDYAATVEAGRRRTCDEEEGVWGVPDLLLLQKGKESMGGAAAGGGEGIVKTVHLNQYAE